MVRINFSSRGARLRLGAPHVGVTIPLFDWPSSRRPSAAAPVMAVAAVREIEAAPVAPPRKKTRRVLLALVILSAATIVLFSIAANAAPLKVTPTWNGGLSISQGSRTMFVAPPAQNPAARLHCSTTGKTTTCVRW